MKARILVKKEARKSTHVKEMPDDKEDALGRDQW